MALGSTRMWAHTPLSTSYIRTSFAYLQPWFGLVYSPLEIQLSHAFPNPPWAACMQKERHNASRTTSGTGNYKCDVFTVFLVMITLTWPLFLIAVLLLLFEWVILLLPLFLLLSKYFHWCCYYDFVEGVDLQVNTAPHQQKEAARDAEWQAEGLKEGPHSGFRV